MSVCVCVVGRGEDGGGGEVDCYCSIKGNGG